MEIRRKIYYALISKENGNIDQHQGFSAVGLQQGACMKK
jgi:hypothetical protein